MCIVCWLYVFNSYSYSAYDFTQTYFYYLFLFGAEHFRNLYNVWYETLMDLFNQRVILSTASWGSSTLVLLVGSLTARKKIPFTVKLSEYYL